MDKSSTNDNVKTIAILTPSTGADTDDEKSIVVFDEEHDNTVHLLSIEDNPTAIGNGNTIAITNVNPTGTDNDNETSLVGLYAPKNKVARLEITNINPTGTDNETRPVPLPVVMNVSPTANDKDTTRAIMDVADTPADTGPNQTVTTPIDTSAASSSAPADTGPNQTVTTPMDTSAAMSSEPAHSEMPMETDDDKFGNDRPTLTVTFCDRTQYSISRGCQLSLSTRTTVHKPTTKPDKEEEEQQRLTASTMFYAISLIAELEYSPEFDTDNKDDRCIVTTRYSLATNQLYTLVRNIPKETHSLRYIVSVTDSFLCKAACLDDGTYYNTLVVDRKAFMAWSLYFLLCEGGLPWRRHHPRRLTYETEIRLNVINLNVKSGDDVICVDIPVYSSGTDTQTQQPIKLSLGQTGKGLFAASMASFFDRLGMEQACHEVLTHMKTNHF